ncbi:uncharacterized protein LOC141998130 [Natator depressus]|uniref:uncharacterized protein LOC141998130 n=1 Tax=Natator depressus TaxID=27790 RepID=UPI003EB6F7A7
MSTTVKLVHEDRCFNADDIGFSKDSGVSATILPLHAKNLPEASLVVPLQTLEVLLIDHPGFTSIEERRNNNCLIDLDLVSFSFLVKQALNLSIVLIKPILMMGMKDRGHNRDPKQCRVKLKELRQAYQKTREANGRSGSEPQTCRFYDELHAILGGSATTTPAVLFDSFNGDGGNTEAGFGDEDDDDDDEVVDSSQQASGETGFPDSQELFLTLDLEPVPPEPTQGCLLDPAGGEGTSAACVSMITGSSPSQRLVKIRKKKKRTRDEMFSELMLSSHTDRAQTNAWRQIMSDCRKAQNDQEERWRAEESKWRAEESKWRVEERAEAERWRQRDERRQDSMLRLLEDQTSMLQCMVELQQRQLEHRLPLQPLCNQLPSSPSSIASTPRRPRTRSQMQKSQVYSVEDNLVDEFFHRSSKPDDRYWILPMTGNVTIIPLKLDIKT